MSRGALESSSLQAQHPRARERRDEESLRENRPVLFSDSSPGHTGRPSIKGNATSPRRWGGIKPARHLAKSNGCEEPIAISPLNGRDPGLFAMHYIIYCDESKGKGAFYSNFYGGVIIKAADRERIEAKLRDAQSEISGEAKWTKITEQDELGYIEFVECFLSLVADGSIRMRVMFTQNIHSTDHVQHYEQEAKYRKLYYQFIKHAFGLMFCNADRENTVDISVYLDDAPDTKDALDNFKDYLASLSVLPDFHHQRVTIDKGDIASINSKEHAILQAVDVVLGAIQFRLNEQHKAIPKGKRRRGKRTRAKERVYKFINKRLREMYPGFNIGVTTGQGDGPQVRWSHPYRHWCFKPYDSIMDRSRGKRRRRKR